MKMKLEEITNKIMQGDSLEVLKTFPDESIDCCITSPPYWGLRDYGNEGQLGLEKTPEEYVANLVNVFKEVKRTLKKDGTFWLNLGDSYAGNCSRTSTGRQGMGDEREGIYEKTGEGLKPKDLVGIPWAVAKALQSPYYIGKIKDEKDRVWLAAMIDAEGCMTMSQYETGGKSKSNIYISITNSNTSIIDNCERIFPQEVKHIYEKSDKVNRTVWRWDVERIDTKMRFVSEVYPYLVAKKKQAILAYTFLLMQKGLPSKKKGYLSAQINKRKLLVEKIQQANKGIDVEIPEWATEPPSLLEEGFYLRQDIIWAKPNPMPESVTDRCTKSHEYIFLLTKSSKYYFNSNAIKEPCSEVSIKRAEYGWNCDRDGTKNASMGGEGIHTKKMGNRFVPEGGRNKRSVWTVNTKPFKEAHFATFPKQLIIPMVKTTKEKAIILDPFMGAGTTALVARECGRNYIGIELNPEYIKIAEERLKQKPLF